ncbi:OLC1v1021495C1 [Oldenlandia corymbosa var. corymbosa]|uniref:OLC1v1021495C1 n=1 Tax=Oldenlandia corymbosa var. corymbosa TaxID=529605 RepID=A0AAV1BX96_OLDCO|nr:OLC1v1021495C1 [Oldenlandia corymbosa var. corymbosa]
METKSSGREDLSTAQAVLIGALAPGVNSPTWNTLKIAFLMLGLSLVAMMGLAFSSSDLTMTLHVVVLVLITGTLFFLLNSFLEQTGLVSVEQQMQEMGLAPKNAGDDTKNK